jgi:tetratricopeptide (TPR) repeat protein
VKRQRLGVERTGAAPQLRTGRSTPSRWPYRAAHEVRQRWVVARVTQALRLAGYWQRTGDLDEAARDGERASRLARGHPAVPVTLAADVALTMARIARDRDDLARASAELEHAIAVLQAAPEAADRLGWALVGLGDLHRRAGNYPAATRVLARALELVESTQPPDPLLWAAGLTSQGITAKELGAYDTAALCYARVSDIHRESGATRDDAATLEHNLAGLQYSRGRYAQAEAHARRALALRHEVPAVTQVDLAADRAVLASALAAQRRYDEARILLGQTLTAYRSARPVRRYEIAVQLHNLADVEHAVGRPAEAEDLYRETLSLKEEVLGGEHPEVGLVANNLGTLLMEQGRPDEAADCLRRALTIAERTYDPDHPLIGRVRRNLELLRHPR